MSGGSGCSIPRRSLLLAGTSLALAPRLQFSAARADASAASGDIQIKVAPGRARLVGPDGPETEVWTYDGIVPGRIVRLRQGEPARIVVENQLDEDTTVHWHGIRLPNAMDGVPGLTQPPIRPGGTFVYEFTPPDAGTFWYHPHANSLQQLGRGLAGAVIVEERTPIVVDRDVLWLLSDWRLMSKAQIAAGFGNAMEAGMAGRIGNVITLNGAVSNEQPAKAGERLRLRLVNAALARIMALRIEGHRPVIVAIDGQPCTPHEPEGGRILLGPAMRIDVVLDMQGEPARSYPIVEDFYDGHSYVLTKLVYGDDPRLHRQPLEGTLDLPRNPLPEPDLALAERHELALEGGMMGGMKREMGGMMGGGPAWAINGMSMTGDGHAGMEAALTFRRGGSVVLKLRNDTAWWHPMHFHGHSFLLLSRNGMPVPHRQWQDTCLMAPRDTVEIAFVADNPGDWMLHCHVMDHQMAGMMTVLRVA